MKYLLILMSFLCSCLFCNCKPNNRKPEGKRVSFNAVGKYSHEMFVVCGNDTSANSFYLYGYNSKKMHIRISSSAYGKHCYIGDGIEKYKVTSYRELLIEFSECLEWLSRKEDVSSLYYISVMLGDMADIAVEATNNYNKLFPGNDDYNPEDVLSAISQTSLIYDINNVLNKYGLEVDKLGFDDYCLLLVDKAVFLEMSVVADRTEVPSKVMEVPLAFYLKKK